MKIPDLNYPVEPHDTWEVMDSSKLQQFMSCPRAYFYEYVLGWRLDEPNNHLHFGHSWHMAMEHLLLNGYDDVAGAFRAFVDAYRSEEGYGEDTDELYDPKNPGNVLRALVLYTEMFKRDREKYEVLYTETAGTVPLDEQDALHFRLDAILRDRSTDEVFVLEHKTAGWLWKWEMQWDLKVQVGTYTHAIYCMFGPEVSKGVMMNGAFFKKNNKTNPVEMKRHPAWKSPQQMNLWLWTVRDWIYQVKQEFERLSKCTEDDVLMQAFPCNTESCTKYTGCPYHNFCCTWPNPLKQAWQPPLGFKIDFWDPRDYEATNKVENGDLVDGKD